MSEVKKKEIVEEKTQNKATENKQEKVEETGEEMGSLKPLKKEHSYTYWVDDKNKSRELPLQNRPKKIQAPEHYEQKIVGVGPSKWNTSGTWQEKVIPTKELNESVSESLKEWMTTNECELELKEVSLEGDFQRIFTNNKRKVLYQLKGKINFEGDDLQIELIDFTCSGDQEYRVKGKEMEQKLKLQSVSGSLVGVMVETFNRYKQ